MQSSHPEACLDLAKRLALFFEYAGTWFSETRKESQAPDMQCVLGCQGHFLWMGIRRDSTDGIPGLQSPFPLSILALHSPSGLL